MPRIAALFAALCLAAVFSFASTGRLDSLVFTRVDMAGGLANGHVQHLTQAEDGRMIITSHCFVDIYDGSRFRHIPTSDSLHTRLSDCNSPYTVYKDNHDRLWFKRWFMGRCLDLKTERYIVPLDSIFRSHGVRDTVSDFFCDRHRRMWVLAGGSLVNLDNTSRRIRIDRSWENLQDIHTADGLMYLFFSTGSVRCYDEKSLAFRFSYNPLKGSDYNAYDLQTLVLQPVRGRLCVCKSGKGKGIVLAYDLRRRSWTELLRTSCVLHGATVTPDGHVFVATPDCVYGIDIQSGDISCFKTFNLQGKWFGFRHFNWIYADTQGGIWLGSYNDGLFYAHPLRGQDYDADGKEQAAVRTVSPLHLIVTGVSIAGERQKIGGRHLPVSERYVSAYDLEYSENSITFEISAQNYVLPSATSYRYKLLRQGSEEGEEAWHDATPDNYMVDANGRLLLHFQNLEPGGYRLLVAAECGDSRDTLSLSLTVRPPWWRTTAAYVAYAAALLLLIAGVSGLLSLYGRRKMRRQHREEMLLAQVRSLIERCNEYEKACARECVEEESSAGGDGCGYALPEADSEFIHRVIQLVERNISSGNYNVEQLSRDMCMERTGLYKKMVALMEKTPSALIRSIRMQKAAALLASGRYTVAEVASRTGFSSTSYFCKVFVAEYRCTPGEYMKR